ncbi:hypothetical protein RHS03_06566, partial [Rhizoctonia solani]
MAEHMSTLPLRSGTGCLTCKCRRKKCDETQPKCMRCQKSGLECPGYIYIQSKRAKRLRTLPAPRENKGKKKARDHGTSQTALSSTSVDLSLSVSTWSEPGRMDAPNNLQDLTGTPTLLGLLDDCGSCEQITLESLGDESNRIQYPPILGVDQQPWLLHVNSAAIPSPSSKNSDSMTSGQVSLLNALFSLGNSSNSTTNSFSKDVSSHSNRSTRTPPDIEPKECSSDDEDLEGVYQVIFQPLPLDKSVESNALPFVLQNYATWIHRMAFEPMKRARAIRSLVAKQFEAGQEARWTLTLLADIGGRLGRGVILGESDISMISTLQTQVRQRLVNGKNIGNDESARQTSIGVLDATIETIVIHLFASPACEWLTLMREAAPIFRRLCPEPAGVPINLPSLLQHANVSLRYYAHTDVLCGAVMDLPMLFRYDCTPQNFPHVYGPIVEIENDSGTQWFHGTPDRFVAMFAKINAMREDGWAPTPEIVAILERGIQDFQPIYSKSCDSFLSATRILVQECWRQVAYIYLYMGLCGDPSDTPRVKRAFKQFIRLLNSTKPGHMPDNFLILNFCAPAARKKRDRDIIRKRVQGIKINGPSHGVNDNAKIFENYWAHADAEGRPTIWSDVGEARKRVLGV